MNYPILVYANDGSVKETIKFSASKDEGMSPEDTSSISSKYQIHKDDSIAQIKNKILLIYPEVSYDELYVFAKVVKRVNLASVYQNAGLLRLRGFNRGFRRCRNRRPHRCRARYAFL